MSPSARPLVRRSDGGLAEQLRDVPAEVYVPRLRGQSPDRDGKLLCPFHEERTASLQVYPDGSWCCFGCRRGGSIVDFAAALWGLGTKGRDFIEVRERLISEFLGVPTRAGEPASDHASGSAWRPFSNQQGDQQMTHEPDGVALEVEQLLTQAGQGVAELARAKAQRRTQALHAATRESAQRAAELNARVAAEQTTASAQLAGVGEPGWWERASAEQIVDAFATAEQWRDSDPQFAQAAQAIRGELKQRFEIDPDSGPDRGAKAPVDGGPGGAEATRDQRLAGRPA